MHELKMANFEAFRQAQNSFFRGVWGLRPNFVEGGGDYGT